MPRPHICAACDPPAFRPFTNGRSYVGLRCKRTSRLRKAQPCSLREWDGRTWKKLERAKGFEPSTPTLARSCSTTELHPHPCQRLLADECRPMPNAPCDCNSRKTVRNRRISDLWALTPPNRPIRPSADPCGHSRLNRLKFPSQPPPKEPNACHAGSSMLEGAEFSRAHWTRTSRDDHGAG